ncbi:MAG: hypothetical protein A3F77_05755 [Betaproteobacteria bacterium RIFCSPLOWO2_12_FULL_67_28]|nr:MAG: hypothetical protein A3F77_05755 [Betaproteobacteria bacterium RIFCSPLOWO2_12_FULL_67_28]
MVSQIADALGPLRQRGALHFRELPVGRKGLDHAVVVGVKALRERVLPLDAGERRGLLARQQPQQRIAQHAARELRAVILQLIEQHRREVDHGAHLVALEMPRHVGVVLDGVQIDPRQGELSARVVAVIRLVHVPQQHQVQAARAHRR